MKTEACASVNKGMKETSKDTSQPDIITWVTKCELIVYFSLLPLSLSLFLSLSLSQVSVDGSEPSSGEQVCLYMNTTCVVSIVLVLYFH